MVQHFKEITTFLSFRQLLRRDYRWEIIKNISIQVVLNAHPVWAPMEIPHTPSVSMQLLLATATFIPGTISQTEDGNALSFKWTRKLLRTSPPCSYASLELQRQMGICQNAFPHSLVTPHSAALHQKRDLSLFSFPWEKGLCFLP